MALDAEFLNGIFANEEVSVDDKIKTILAEHEADNRGLIQKRDQLLGQEKKLKETIAGYETGKGEYESRIATLEEELKKNSPEQHQQYYNAQLEKKQKEFDEKYAQVVGERDYFKKSHLERLRNDAISDGVKDIQFLDGLRNGFVATVLMNNNFEAKDIDGKLMFLNAENKTIQDVIHEFALTPEGKAYIKNPISGGNAHSSYNTPSANRTDVLSREEYNELVKNPAKFAEFRKNHKNWSVAD